MSDAESPHPDLSLVASEADAKVAESIRALLQITNTSLRSFAEAVGLSEKVLGNRLAGRSEMKNGEVRAFAAYWQVPTDMLYEPDTITVDWAAEHRRDLLRRRSAWIAQTAA